MTKLNPVKSIAVLSAAIEQPSFSDRLQTALGFCRVRFCLHA